MRKHFEVAKAVLEIAQAQWTPKKEAEARYKMITHDDDDDGDDGDGESDGSEALEVPRIYKEIVDEQHTIENIGHVSMQVNSHTRAFELLVRSWAVAACTLYLFLFANTLPQFLLSSSFPRRGRTELPVRLSTPQSP